MQGFDLWGYPYRFSLTFVKCNRNKRTGGELVSVENAVLYKHKKWLNTPRHRVPKISQIVSKNPNHTQNQTRNIYVIQTGKILKVHIRLIVRFDRQDVVY
jgi:hypothetical protein